jgi:hypothetical protein
MFGCVVDSSPAFNTSARTHVRVVNPTGAQASYRTPQHAEPRGMHTTSRKFMALHVIAQLCSSVNG